MSPKQPRKYPPYRLGWQCRQCTLLFYGYTQEHRPPCCRNLFCGAPGTDLIEFDALELDELRDALVWAVLRKDEPRTPLTISRITGLSKHDVVRSLFLLSNFSLTDAMLHGVFRRHDAPYDDPFEAAADARKAAEDARKEADDAD